MLRSLTVATATGIALVSASAHGDTNPPSIEGPPTRAIDISAHAGSGERDDCRLTGEAILWASRRVEVRDGARAGAGTVTAGLAQFGKGSSLGGCVPDGAALNLSDQFATFVMAESSDAPGRREATLLASRLGRQGVQLADPGGAVIPVVEGVTFRAAGSASYRFRIVLIVPADAGPIDAVILRETLGTKFSPRWAEADRRSSRLKWSSGE